ncbi:hypothetical protein MIR68_004849 [Amoeboaphelidium protococcarum]|nr:hypothetical protein MIR68_004849 [Amoeboaphelidium protococcarum]
MQLSLVSVGNCLPDGSLQLTKDQFYRACDSIMLRVRNFLVGHPSDSINRENFDRYLVIMFCLLAEIDEVAERIGAQKSVVLTLSFNAGCQHMLFSRKAFLGCEDPVLSREDSLTAALTSSVIIFHIARLLAWICIHGSFMSDQICRNLEKLLNIIQRKK